MNWQTTGKQLGWLIVIELLLGTSVVAWGGIRWSQKTTRRALPVLRNEPRVVLPEYDYESVVSQEQLQRLLTKLRPRFVDPALLGPGEHHITLPKLNHLDHALRFWTVDARFDEPGYISGAAMRQLMTDHRRFVEVYGPEQPSLLVDKGAGIGVRVNEGVGSSSHVDHTMAGLAEVGTPLDFPLILANRQGTYREMVEQSLREFSINQTEYEWSTLTYALFSEQNRWVTREGQEITFDMLANRFFREDLPKGVCYANHRLYTLAILLRVDDQWQAEGRTLLQPRTRAKVVEFLQAMTRKLIEHQHASGCWNGAWPSAAPSSALPSDREGDTQADRLLATGHALEWWAMAPAEVHPPREVMIRAAQWLVAAIDDLDQAKVEEYYTFLTHAGRALSIWRKENPAHWLALPRSRQTSAAHVASDE